MFTGLVTDIGEVVKAEDRNGLQRFRVASSYPVSDLSIGASIMHSGICLTVVDFGAEQDRSWFEVEAVPETLNKTNLGELKPGDKLNLELSLKLGSELGGHFVFGHVDGLGEIVSIQDEGQSHRVRVRPPRGLARYFATKGSVAIDGVSLTVAEALDNGDFEVAVIPHTWQVTTLGQLQVGRKVNLEVDMLARYVARMVGADAPRQGLAG